MRPMRLYGGAAGIRNEMGRLAAPALALTQEQASVRDAVVRVMRRTTWLHALRGLPRRMQRYDVLKAQCVGDLAHHCTRPRSV